MAGDTIYWKARPMKAVDGLGTVLGFWGSVCSFYTPILYEGFEDTFTGSLPDGWYTTDGWYDYGWSVTSETSKTGDKCLVSDDIGNSDEATVYLEVYCSKPSTVSFYKKVSSEAGYDELEFYIDNEKMDEWSGLLSLWTRVSYDLDTGSHELKWIYDKDSSTSSGSDRAWIDEVVVK